MPPGLLGRKEGGNASWSPGEGEIGGGVPSVLLWRVRYQPLLSDVYADGGGPGEPGGPRQRHRCL